MQASPPHTPGVLAIRLIETDIGVPPLQKSACILVHPWPKLNRSTHPLDVLDQGGSAFMFFQSEKHGTQLQQLWQHVVIRRGAFLPTAYLRAKRCAAAYAAHRKANIALCCS